MHGVFQSIGLDRALTQRWDMCVRNFVPLLFHCAALFLEYEITKSKSDIYHQQ